MELLDLSDFMQTKDEANDFLTRIATISEKVYQLDFHLEKELMNEFGVIKKDKFMTLLRTNAINYQSNAALKDFFTKIQEKIAALPLLSLTIAFEPKEKTLQMLSQWIILNTHKQMLFVVHVDPSLVAGATIDYSGKHVDFSIKSKFNQILTTQVSMPKESQQPQVKNEQLEHKSSHQIIPNIMNNTQ